jgi:hypothetical protein
MSWIDIYLADGDARSNDGATAREALSKMLQWWDFPLLVLRYRREGLPLRDVVAFLALHAVRGIAYRRGFRAGAEHPWREEQR